jgi:hypothetical protein
MRADREARKSPREIVSFGRLILALGGIMVAGYLLLIGYVFLRPVAEQYWYARAFEPVAWRAERGTPMWPMRLRMVDDLLERHSFIGVTRDSVERLLGPRDTVRGFEGWDMVYGLGPERNPLGIDHEWLAFKLGPDGRVTKYEIIHD